MWCGKNHCSGKIKRFFNDKIKIKIFHLDKIPDKVEITIEWRLKTLSMFKELLRNIILKKNIDIVLIEGMIRPKDMLSIINEFKQDLEVYFILLDVSERVRELRLKKRKAPKFLINEKENLLSLRDEITLEKNYKIINTDHFTPEHIASEILEYILDNL